MIRASVQATELKEIDERSIFNIEAAGFANGFDVRNDGKRIQDDHVLSIWTERRDFY